jgi:hypothetical protein
VQSERHEKSHSDYLRIVTGTEQQCNGHPGRGGQLSVDDDESENFVVELNPFLPRSIDVDYTASVVNRR